MNSPLPGYMPGEEQAHYRHEAGVVTLPPSYSSTTFEPITSQPGPIPIEQFGTPYGLQGPDTVAFIPYGLGYLSTIDTIVVFRECRVTVCDEFRHSIKNINGEQIYYTMCERYPSEAYHNGSLCAFVAHMGDNLQKQVLTMKIPYHGCGEELEGMVECPPGQLTGKLMIHWGCCQHDVLIRDFRGNPLFNLIGHSTCTARDYKIVGMNGVQIGAVTTVGLFAPEYIIKCPMNLDVNVKAFLISSIFLLDYSINQRNNRSS